MPSSLKKESSFYLQQHANHSIHWYPWGEKALTQAKEEKKSIFLSIGYSACHWCEVMEQESFQNDVIATLINERFIAIKVDKEEHPEIAKYYQKVYKLMNRSTPAFPLSIFLTENLQPFYADSYISIEAKEEKLGFEELLRVISKKYITDHDTLVKKGDEVLQYINPKEKKIEATKLHIDIVNTIQAHTDNLLDKKEGGFGATLKFPNTSTLELLLDTYQLTQEESLLTATLLSLDAMYQKNLYDSQDGAFYNHTKDANWLTPNKVKTTYDNALFIQLYLRAYHLTQNDDYKKVAMESINFMLNKQSESNLFFAKIDARNNELIIDKTIITSWNAMMISSLFQATILDSSYKSIAITSLETLLNKIYKNNTLYHNADLTTQGFLEDYAYLGETLIHAYQATLDEFYLIMATQFANKLIEDFYDYGQWKFTNGLFQIEADIHDIDYPSSISTAISLLISISSLVDIHYKKFVFKTLEINSYNLMRQPLSSPKLTSMLLRYLKDDIIIKSNEELLAKNLNQKNKLGYPFILYKTTVDENILLCNSSTCFATETTFDNITTLIKSHT